MSLWIGQMEPFAGSINRYFLSPGQEIEIPVSCQIFAGGRTIEPGHQDEFRVELWADLGEEGFRSIPMAYRRQSDLYYEYETKLAIGICGAFRLTVRFSTDGGKSWIYQNDFYQGDKLCLDAFVAASAAWIQEASIYSIAPEALPDLESLDNGLAYISSLGTNAVHLRSREPEALGSWLDEIIKRAHSLGLKVIVDWLCPPPEGGLFGYYSDEDDWIEVGSYPAARWDEMITSLADWMDRHGVDGICCEGVHRAPIRFWQQMIRTIKRMKPDALVIGKSGNPRLVMRAFDAADGNLWGSLQGFPSGRDIKSFFLERDSHFPKHSLFLQYVESPETRMRSAVRWGSSLTAFSRFAIAATTPGMPLIYNGQEISDAALLPLDEPCALDWHHLVEESKLLHQYAKLMRLRRDIPALGRGRTYFLNLESGQDSIFAFLRYEQDGAAIVAINLDSHRAQKVAFRIPIWELKFEPTEAYLLVDHWNGTEPSLFSGQDLSVGLEISLEPNGVMIAKLEPKLVSKHKHGDQRRNGTDSPKADA